MSRIEVVDWSPRWEQFDEVAAVLREALAGIPSRVAHGGSTSVPGWPPSPSSTSTNVRNHLAVRDVLGSRDDPRDAYAAVKHTLAEDPAMDVDTYLAGKSALVQQVLEVSGEFTDEELTAIHRLNEPGPDALTKR